MLAASHGHNSISRQRASANSMHCQHEALPVCFLPLSTRGLTNPMPVAPLLAETSSAHRLNALATDYVLLRAFTIQLGARSVMLRIPLPEYDGFALTWLLRPNS